MYSLILYSSFLNRPVQEFLYRDTNSDTKNHPSLSLFNLKQLTYSVAQIFYVLVYLLDRKVHEISNRDTTKNSLKKTLI